MGPAKLKQKLWAALLIFVVTIGFARAAEPDQSGLVATYITWVDGKQSGSDVVNEPSVSLYVPAGHTPTPFLPPLPVNPESKELLPGGKFTVTWTGFVAADLRSEYQFQADLSGRLRVDINGRTVFEAAATNGSSALSKSVTLNKGANAFTAVFTSLEKSDAYVRLRWKEADEGAVLEPIARKALSQPPDVPALGRANQLRLGRESIFEYRCLRCHTAPVSEAVPDAAMDGPSFGGIGGRRNYDWMRRWILDPHALRSTARMPRMLHGAGAADQAKTIAAYLTSLKGPKIDGEAPAVRDEDIEAGRELFDKLLCAGCHNGPEAEEVDPQKISLQRAREKFAAGALRDFLLKPEAHYEWIRMPNFKLSSSEAAQLAAYLEHGSSAPASVETPEDESTLEKGRELVQTLGCLNCHALELPNRFTAPRLEALPAVRWDQGCLAAEHAPDSKAPQFNLNAAQREALNAFASTDRESLNRYAAPEFAERQTRLLNCTACHGQQEGFPGLEILGAKLQPEWMQSFLAGNVDYKPRPWLELRMPAFKAVAPYLAQALVMQHGFPPRTPARPPIDLEMAAIGRKLAGPDGGFNCVSCHAVGSVKATQVFESEGINFVHSAERLLRDYYHRWVLNPLKIEPQTKMPTFFDQGRSPLTEVLDGDAEKQIQALWEYLRLGRKMPSPLPE